MATDARSRLRQAAKLAVVALVVGPVLVQWGFVGADLVPAVSQELLVRLAGLVAVAGVLAALVRQKRRSRGQSASRDAPERPGDRTTDDNRADERPTDADRRTDGSRTDRRVEGSGEVYAPYAYNNQQQARREGRRGRERAEEVARADREARKRR